MEISNLKHQISNNFINSRQGRAGYTLIEILVGLTIIGIIFGVGFSSFREFSRRQSLAGGVKIIVGDLRLAQEQAIAGKKPEDLKCTNGLLGGYNFRVVPPRTYQVEADCTGGVIPVIIKTVTISSDLTLTVPTVNPILFKALGQGTNIPEGEETFVNITQAGTNAVAPVTVSSGGEIR